MSSTPSNKQSSLRQWVIKLHLWLGVGAAIFWLLQALTGVLLTFHFEIDDARLSTAHYPTDFAAIEHRIEQMGKDTGTKANWIWTTAGLADRYMLNHTDADGITRIARIHGNGEVLRNDKEGDYSVLEFAREIHLELLSGRGGQIFLGISGILLITNLIFGVIAAWPRRGSWLKALKPTNQGATVTRLYSWHRAIGLWIAIPALIFVAAGTLIQFEHDIEHLIGIEPPHLPVIPAKGTGIGFAEAANTAVQAIPGSQFVATVFPSEENASYEVWLRQPGELFRRYGGSLVIINANDGAVRGAFPATEASAAQKFILALYPVHTGEAIGVIGRILSLLVGLWLITSIIFGVLLWLKRRSLKPNVTSA